MVRSIIFVFLTTSILFASSKCTKTILLKKNNIEVFKSNGLSCKSKGIYLRLPQYKIKIEGEIFENIFFFNTNKKKILAVFTMAGAHTHIITFFEKIQNDRYVKIKNGSMSSDTGMPFVAFDPLGIDSSILVKSRYTKILNISNKVCRVLLEKTYRYEKTKNTFILETSDKELLKECVDK